MCLISQLESCTEYRTTTTTTLSPRSGQHTSSSHSLAPLPTLLLLLFFLSVKVLPRLSDIDQWWLVYHQHLCSIEKWRETLAKKVNTSLTCCSISLDLTQHRKKKRGEWKRKEELGGKGDAGEKPSVVDIFHRYVLDTNPLTILILVMLILWVQIYP